jgi:hypothetical protein
LQKFATISGMEILRQMNVENEPCHQAGLLQTAPFPRAGKFAMSIRDLKAK